MEEWLPLVTALVLLINTAVTLYGVHMAHLTEKNTNSIVTRLVAAEKKASFEQGEEAAGNKKASKK